MKLSELLKKENNNLDVFRLLAACMVIYGRAYAIAPQGGRFNVVACLCGRGRKYPGSLAGHRQLFAWRAHALRSATSTAL